MMPLRRPARTPAPPRRAEAWAGSPAPAVARWFEHLLAERMRGLPFLNPALSVQALDFRRVDGDWLGGVTTPWSVQLMLLPGGGSLWVDTSPGERSMVALPVGRLTFIADEGDHALPAFQYLPLVNATAALAGDDAARAFVRDALATALRPPAVAVEASAAAACDADLQPEHAAAPAGAVRPPADPAAIDPGRRRFLRFGAGAAAHR
ncbi:[NiFe]-hydrogenase assembly chaperone HybE [Thauera phenylacetica]